MTNPIERLRALLSEATPGPWEATPTIWKSRTSNYTLTACGIESRDPELVALGGGAIAYATDTGQIAPEDAALICAAINAAPALLAVAAAAQEYLTAQERLQALMSASPASLVSETEAAYYHEIKTRLNLRAALAELSKVQL
jgi:hypothetical protein